LPDDFVVVVNESPSEVFWNENHDLAADLARNGCFCPMKGVFRLWSTAEAERPDVTLWYMEFLESKAFLCLTAPRDEWDEALYL